MHHCRGEGATVLGGARPELICLLRREDYVVNCMRFTARFIRRQPEAGDAGLEPASAGVKVPCLTTWRIPNGCRFNQPIYAPPTGRQCEGLSYRQGCTFTFINPRRGSISPTCTLSQYHAPPHHSLFELLRAAKPGSWTASHLFVMQWSKR